MSYKDVKYFPVMENMTVKTVADYLAEKQSILIPIGVNEQHGYHLPLCTDACVATRVAKRIGEASGTLVAPTMYQSFSGGDCPGTINISPAVMSLVLSDMLVSLASQGFRNFYLFLCHGGSENARALNDAIKILLRTNPIFRDVMIVLMPIWDCDVKRTSYRKGFAEHDWHAGWVETSIMLSIAPELVHMDELILDEEPFLQMQIEHPDNYQHAEKIVDDPLVIPRQTQRSEIKVGVMGYPERASAEIGRRAVEDIVEYAAGKIADLDSRADGTYKEVDFRPEPLIFDL